MKTCCKCNESKNTSHFYKREKGKPAAYCKRCFNEYCMQRWQIRKLTAIERFGNKCHDCKQSFHPNIYDFHHLHGKDYDWAKLRGRKQETIDKELSKCIMLCANCHRIRHIN